MAIPAERFWVCAVTELSTADLYRAHARQVARWAAALGGPDCDPSDVVQDVFLVVERRLPEFRQDAKATTWLFRITQNVVRTHRRRRRSFFTLRERLGWLPPAPPINPEQTVEQAQARKLVYEVLDGIGETYRQVFILFEIEGLSGAEIATMLDVSESVVWVRLSRARKKFAEKLDRHMRRSR